MAVMPTGIGGSLLRPFWDNILEWLHSIYQGTATVVGGVNIQESSMLRNAAPLLMPQDLALSPTLSRIVLGGLSGWSWGTISAMTSKASFLLTLRSRRENVTWNGG